ncbi:MAG: hypothetical protein SFY80_12535 [Verrucomicrobiota bacterium]|nr:hypothetical protein [Verrucomicrobiota bacterium]
MNNIFKNRYAFIIILLIVSALLYLYYNVIDYAAANAVAIKYYYWIALLLFIINIVVLTIFINSIGFSRIRAMFGVSSLIVIIASSVFLQLPEPRAYKILHDEYILTAMSLNFHINREPGIPVTVHKINDTLVINRSFVDKRAVIYPFILSIFHDVIGYRPENAYILNYICSLVLLTAVYIWGVFVRGRYLGILAVLLLTSSPLLAQMATGAGYDLMNGTLFVIFTLFLHYYISQGSALALNALVYSGLMLTYCRYESGVYLLVIPIVVIYKCFTDKYVNIPWLSVLSPLFLLCPLLSNIIYTSNAQFVEGGGDLLSFKFINANIEHAIYYLFNYEGDTSNSLLISVSGVLSLVIFLVCIKRFIKNPCCVAEKTLVIIMIPCFINTMIFMLLFWGYFDDPMASRFSFTLQLYFILVTIAMIGSIGNINIIYRYIIGFVVLYIYCVMLPVSNRHIYTNRAFSHREIVWSINELRAVDKSNSLVLSNAPAIYCHGYAAIQIGTANLLPDRVKSTISRGIYKNIYVFTTERLDYSSGIGYSVAPAPLSERYTLEIISELRLRANYISRFYKVVQIDCEDIEDIKTNSGAKWKYSPLSQFPYESELDLLSKYFNELP